MDHNGQPVPEWLTGCAEWRGQGSGAIVIGGSYAALGAVRSLGRHKIPVCVLTDERLIARLSRYAWRSFRWPEAGDAGQVEYLFNLAKQYGLLGWAIFPIDDESAAMVARQHALLSQRFRLTIPPWDTLCWAYDKRLTYNLASELGVDSPWTVVPGSREAVAGLDCAFPAILKPAVKQSLNEFTQAKAWRVTDRSSLLARYDEASALVDPSVIMIQEMIPGGGEEQYSYAGVCVDGRPVAWLSARRTRQYPLDFGRSSSYVETVECPEIEEPTRQLLAAMHFTGLVEVEFKRDRRNGLYKLLDINPRVWGWHTVGRAAGVDFPYLLWRIMQGEEVPEVCGRAGVRWIRMATDLLAASAGIRSGHLSPLAYLQSLRGPIESAVFAVDDPLPGLLELPLLVYQEWKQRRRYGRVQSSSHSLESRSGSELERISRGVPIPSRDGVPKGEAKA